MTSNPEPTDLSPSQAAASQSSTVLVDINDRVATVTLNRPRQLNAFTPEMRTLLMQTLTRLDEDPGIRCVVLTGSGRGFCAGADLATLQDLNGAKMRRRLDEEPIRLDYPLHMTTPLIAAVNGPAAGIGLAYALMADIRVAAEGAKWAASFAALGLVAEHGLSWLLPRLVGTGAALELMLTAEPITSEAAYRIGLVQHVLPADQVLAEAQRLAAVIASRSPYSLRAIKEQVRLDAARSWEEGYLDMRERLVACLDEPDFAEAMAAQRAKRAPDFRREVT
jgi:enoyl-CoA hydratase/carnithine racemase